MPSSYYNTIKMNSRDFIKTIVASAYYCNIIANIIYDSSNIDRNIAKKTLKFTVFMLGIIPIYLIPINDMVKIDYTWYGKEIINTTHEWIMILSWGILHICHHIWLCKNKINGFESGWKTFFLSQILLIIR